MTTRSPFLCLDLRRCAFLVWTAARARALQQQTQIEWQPYRGSKTLNAIYSVLFWKEGPGTVEIRQDQRKIAALTDQFFDHMFDEFLFKSFMLGPVGLARYADSLVAMRAEALRSVGQLFQQASSINSEVAGEAREAIQTLAKVKLASALALTGLGCYVVLSGATVVLIAQVGAVKMVNDYASLTTGMIVAPQNQINACVMGVGYQLFKTGADLRSNKMVDEHKEIGEKALKEYEPKLKSAEKRIERYCSELAGKIRGSKRVVATRRLDKALLDAGAAGHIVENAEKKVKLARNAGMAVSLVFAAWDIYDALNSYSSDMASAQ